MVTGVNRGLACCGEAFCAADGHAVEGNLPVSGCGHGHLGEVACKLRGISAAKSELAIAGSIGLGSTEVETELRSRDFVLGYEVFEEGWKITLGDGGEPHAHE